MPPPPILKHHLDTYKSAIISDEILDRPTKETPIKMDDVLEFETRLLITLQELKRKNARGVWLKLVKERSDFVPPAIRAGFIYHSAGPKSVTLSLWLPENEENRLPPGPLHFIGVGAFVMNSKGVLLVVREKTGPSAKMSDFWKLPGGLTDKHENFHEAAIRECFEETGLKTEFVSVASIQEVHHMDDVRSGPARMGTTDLYVICILKPIDENQPLVPCEKEIADCKVNMKGKRKKT